MTHARTADLRLGLVPPASNIAPRTMDSARGRSCSKILRRRGLGYLIQAKR